MMRTPFTKRVWLPCVLLSLLLVSALTFLIEADLWPASADHDANHWDAQIIITADSPDISLNPGLSTLNFGVHPDAHATGDAGLDVALPPAPPQPNIVFYFRYPNNEAGFTQLTNSRISPSDTKQWPLFFDALLGANPATTIDIEITSNFAGVGETPGPPAETDVIVDLVDPLTGELIETLGNLRDGPVSHTFNVLAFSFFKQGSFLIRVVEPPTAVISAPATGNEGSPITFDGSISTPAEGATIVSYQWDFGDGTTSSGVVVEHVYADDGIYTVALTLTDNLGATDTATHLITINNVAPTITTATASPNPIRDPILEGESGTITITATDSPGDVPDLLYSFDCDSDTVFEVGPQAGNSADCTYPDGPANVNVNVQVADQDGGIEAEALSVTVLNAVPAVTDVVANPARLPVEGGTSLITVSATDVPGDTLDFSFDCDGDAIFEVGPLAGNFTACTFTAEDQSVNSVNVRVEDGDGGVAAGDVTVSVGAITLLVTKTGDTNDGICNEDCSLREAIDVALSGDSIDVPAGTYTLTLGSELVIGTSLTLTGAGSGDTVIQAAAEPNVANSRVFLITGDSNVAIGDVTVRHGRAAGNGWGGGIVSTIGSRLTITNSTISGNWAQAAGGISNTGTLILTHSTINGNRVGSWAGGFYNGGTLTMTNSKVRDNTASAGSGGIHNFPWHPDPEQQHCQR